MPGMEKTVHPVLQSLEGQGLPAFDPATAEYDEQLLQRGSYFGFLGGKDLGWQAVVSGQNLAQARELGGQYLAQHEGDPEKYPHTHAIYCRCMGTKEPLVIKGASWEYAPSS